MAVARLTTGIFNGLLSLALYFKVGYNPSLTNTINLTGVCFIMVTNAFFGTFFGALTVFQIERPVFLRE